jgi:hypothetical protein
MSDLTPEQKYYEYNPSEGGSWWLKTPPEEPTWFQEELNRFEGAGLTDRGQPKLRVSWAGTLLHDITERPQLKYKRVMEIIDGYYYQRRDGSTGTCKSMNLPKDAVVPWQFYPKKIRLELGRLRWVIERHVPAHELREKGRFQNRRAPDGELILRELPEEGVYDHFFWVQSAKFRYRELDHGVLTAIKAMWQYEITASEAQKTLDAIEQEQNQVLVSAEEAASIWENMPHHS